MQLRVSKTNNHEHGGKHGYSRNAERLGYMAIFRDNDYLS
jgi:hypothetical protein